MNEAVGKDKLLWCNVPLLLVKNLTKVTHQGLFRDALFQSNEGRVLEHDQDGFSVKA